MSIVPTLSAAANRRKQLAPVNVTAHFVGGATRADLLQGAAVLSITDTGTQDEKAYWCESLFLDGQKLVGFRLRPFASAEVYDVPLALDTCTCADATYRPERPGGCRHQQALRQSLPTVVKDEPAPVSNAA
jgi:hypothetical protein